MWNSKETREKILKTGRGGGAGSRDECLKKKGAGRKEDSIGQASCKTFLKGKGICQ